MYAIVETGGKQYKVNAGQVVDVELLPQSIGDSLELTQVLMVVDDQNVTVGNPVVAGAVVKATVTEQVGGPKVRMFRYTGKKYRRRSGHRQQYTRLHIDEITVG
ncbi:MAG: 50S ribosomal protein L21 [Anaerolineae bacterium]|nr:50S ribosomal protein L21 [Anaerolineae bacterium]